MNHIQKKTQKGFDRKEFGKRVKQARHQANISSNQLGNNNCHVEPAFIRQIESGLKLPSIPILVQICNSLQVSPSYLLEKEVQFQNTRINWNELTKQLLQIPPIFRQIIHEILNSLIENLAEAERNYPAESNIEENYQFQQEEFGRRLCKVREEMQLTPQQLAINCNITATFIHQIEAGTKLPSLTIFASLCKVLQVSPSYLLGNELKAKLPYDSWKEFEQIQHNMTPKAQKITVSILDILIRNFAELWQTTSNSL